MGHKTLSLYDIMDIGKKGELTLPNFQRRFIWKRNQIEELLESVISGYFMGSFLFLEVRPDDAPFSPMLIEGVENIYDNVELNPHYMILDGQQRITSLFYALYAPDISLADTKYPYKYYLNLRKATNILYKNDSAELDEAIISTRFKKYDNINLQYEEAIIPFTKLASLKSFEEAWLEGYRNFCEKNGKLDHNELNDFRRLREDIGKYQIEIISLAQNEFTILEIVEIFVRVNSKGTALKVFELLTSRFYQFGINLREMWEYCFEEYEYIRIYSEDLTDQKLPQYILQAIALKRNINPKKKNLFELKETNFKDDWLTASRHIEEAYTRLSNIKNGGYGVRKGWIPYAPMVPPLAVLLYRLEDRGSSAANLNKIHRWYWASIFSNRYERSTDTRAFNDVKEVTDWFDNNEEEPEVIQGLEYDDIELYDRAQKNGAIYQGVISLILLRGARDFFLDDTIELHELDDHHIFPKAYLNDKGIKGDKVNNILNRTLIASRTNRKINKKAPSEYLEDMKSELGSESKVEDVLSTHFINRKAYTAMKNDDYDGFLEAREEELMKEIKKRTKP